PFQNLTSRGQLPIRRENYTAERPASNSCTLQMAQSAGGFRSGSSAKNRGRTSSAFSICWFAQTSSSRFFKHVIPVQSDSRSKALQYSFRSLIPCYIAQPSGA